MSPPKGAAQGCPVPSMRSPKEGPHACSFMLVHMWQSVVAVRSGTVVTLNAENVIGQVEESGYRAAR